VCGKKNNKFLFSFVKPSQACGLGWFAFSRKGP